MSKKKPEHTAAHDTTHAAEAAQREDPMTSFDPEADRAAPSGEADASDAPSERDAPGNGSTDASRRAAGEATPAEAPATEAVPEQAEAKGTPEGPSELELAQQEAAGNYDRFVRLQAEFENYKRRIAKEHADSLRYALTPLVTDVAHVMDDLERAMEHARKEQGDAVSALLTGIEMVLKHMYETLNRYGVTRMEAVGKPFDPERHEAINVVETNEVPENQVLEEYQAGYILHDRVIRPARVCVSKRGSDAGRQAPPAGN
ncbi:MAG TPA: nucleotide exchange factor GrpE [bacterium]|nr:nucleotide exchange factor GrpE [bacterium]